MSTIETRARKLTQAPARTYSRTVFLLELKNCSPPAQMGTVSEKDFMDALTRTNATLNQRHDIRSLRSDLLYRGPQSYAHRHDTQRLSFEPFKNEAEGQHRARANDNPMPMLQCSVESCRKWRRVDACTCDLFTTRAWMQDALSDYQKEHLLSLEALRAHVEALLQGDQRTLDLEDFQELASATGLNIGSPLSEIAAIDLCEDLLAERAGTTLSEGLMNHRITLFNSLPGGPRFKCTDLVDTTCEDTDDWDAAFVKYHDLRSCQHFF